MRSPADMKIIQIELTNACPNRCSNCTRLCGHHKKPFFLGWDEFKTAVKSLQGFGGMAGLMGGEPTLHKEFERFAVYLQENFAPERTPLVRGRKPIPDMGRYIVNELLHVEHPGRCLCTSSGKSYYKHFEIIQETFHYQLLNDHRNNGLHQGILVARKEFGIPDEQWIKLRDSCWLQNNWSASITPKGAFFCEVAATLDMLFDGPGGWPIEPGWWRRTPEDFGEQLNWCELCGIAFNGPKTLAKDETDDISPGIFERMKSLGSPKIKAGKYKICHPTKDSITNTEYTPGKPFYLPHGDRNKRLAGLDPSMLARAIHGITFAQAGFDLTMLKKLRPQVNSLLVSSSMPFQEETANLAALDIGILDHTRGICAVLAGGGLADNDWIAVFSPFAKVADDWRKRLGSVILNPGCLYVYGLTNPLRMDKLPLASSHFPGHEKVPAFAFCLFNLRARSLRCQKRLPISLEEIFKLWQSDKIIPIDDKFDELPSLIPVQKKEAKPAAQADVLRTELMREHLLSLWEISCASCDSIALYGAGQHTKWLLAQLKEHGLKLPCVIFDDSPKVEAIQGVAVEEPGARAIELVLISSDANAADMEARAKEIWISGERIVNPYCQFRTPLFKKT